MKHWISYTFQWWYIATNKNLYSFPFFFFYYYYYGDDDDDDGRHRRCR